MHLDSQIRVVLFGLGGVASVSPRGSSGLSAARTTLAKVGPLCVAFSASAAAAAAAARPDQERGTHIGSLRPPPPLGARLSM